MQWAPTLKIWTVLGELLFTYGERRMDVTEYRMLTISQSTIRTFHLKVLDDQRRASVYNIGRELGERTVFDAHYLQVGTESEFKGKIMQIGVVVNVQSFQIFQCSCNNKTVSTFNFD